MCNLYSHTRNVEAIRKLFANFNDAGVNVPPLPGIFPDYAAPIVRNDEGGPRLAMTRWGMPSSTKALLDAATKRADKLRAKGKEVDFDQMLRMEPDGGTTNVRNTSSSHRKRWLGVESRCLVPFNSFSEFNREAGGDIWFAFGEDRPPCGSIGTGKTMELSLLAATMSARWHLMMPPTSPRIDLLERPTIGRSYPCANLTTVIAIETPKVH